MKTLTQFLEDAMATPGNTMGAGNPSLPGMNGEIGSGDLLVQGDIEVKHKRRRRRKKYQDEDDEERNSR